MSCAKVCRGKKVTPVKANDVDLCLCDVNWVNFNAGPGSAKWDIDEQIKSIKNPSAPYTKIWFRCGGFNGLTETPAWELDALMGFDTPDGSDTPKTWEVGFIQTVESLTWEAFYEQDWGRKAMTSKARDGDKTAVAPWYGPPGAKGEPETLEDVTKADHHPQFSDDPQTSIFLSHPDAPCRALQEVTMNGKFHLWLIARNAKDNLDLGHISFLWWASITVDKRWSLPYGADPQLLPNWKASGKQEKTFGPGRGSKTPILDSPLANDNLPFGTHKKGKVCAAGGK